MPKDIEDDSPIVELRIPNIYNLSSGIYELSTLLNRILKGKSSGPLEVRTSLKILRKRSQLRRANQFQIRQGRKMWIGSGKISPALTHKILELKPDRLFLGPNLDIHDSNVRAILQNIPESRFLVPSIWVRDYFVDFLGVAKEKILVWAAGVDTKYWSPSMKDHQFFLIYVKGNFDLEARNLLNKLSTRGFRGSIYTYGAYSQSQYRKDLKRASFAIFLVGTESQGIAQLQAWSCDVPTLVLKQDIYVPEILVDGQVIASSSPYLSSATGLFFKFEDIEIEIDIFLSRLGEYSPRDWVITNMSLEVAASNFLTLFKS